MIKHHFEKGQHILFTGDVAGVKIGGPERPVMPPCPPPDINIEAWLESIAWLRKRKTTALFLTHFDRVEDVQQHWNELEKRLLDWAEWMRPHAETGTEVITIIPLFEDYVRNQLLEAGVPLDELPRYEAANPAFMSVAGLMRYWKKKWQAG
jgi:glyoxylase-like metal-dependent hydrolase (beta-lactamase superfamily II)